MGWVSLLLLGTGAMAALVLLGLARPLWSLVGAGLMLGGAGYALQGSPGLPASPARPTVDTAAVEPGLVFLREQMFGRFTAADAYLMASDAMLRSGDATAAARLLLGGIGARRANVALWTELGTTLALRDGDRVSAPALFAFRQAAHLAPTHPGPPFFLGLALVRAGEFARARAAWARALALAPAGAPYRPLLAQRIVLLDRLLRDGGQEAGADGAR